MSNLLFHDFNNLMCLHSHQTHYTYKKSFHHFTAQKPHTPNNFHVYSGFHKKNYLHRLSVYAAGKLQTFQLCRLIDQRVIVCERKKKYENHGYEHGRFQNRKRRRQPHLQLPSQHVFRPAFRPVLRHHASLWDFLRRRTENKVLLEVVQSRLQFIRSFGSFLKWDFCNRAFLHCRCYDG